MSRTPKHFLDLDQIDANTLREILDIGVMLKRESHPLSRSAALAGKTLAMLFEKPSTRTRVSFEVGMKQLGGDVTILSQQETQLGRGESIADTARVLSRYVDAIMIRTDEHKKLFELSEFCSVPVINGLTDLTHPCQLLADIMTFEEHRGPIAGRVVAWLGDGNNVSNSWIQAAARFNFELRLACPLSMQPREEDISWARSEGATIVIDSEPGNVVQGADCVVTDTWVSMGDETGNRLNVLAPYQVNKGLMGLAKPDALFMHCLPAHRGEEVVGEVMDGPQSVVWDEAENRLHAHKGVLLWAMGL